MMRIGLAVLAVALYPVAASAAGDAVKGKAIFLQCSACHKADKSGASLIGPNLYGVVGRPVAAVANFKYSPAMKAKQGTWTVAALDAYLAAPSRAMPGNRMPFAGMPRASDRADVIAYLSSMK